MVEEITKKFKQYISIFPTENDFQSYSFLTLKRSQYRKFMFYTIITFLFTIGMILIVICTDEYDGLFSILAGIFGGLMIYLLSRYDQSKNIFRKKLDARSEFINLVEKIENEVFRCKNYYIHNKTKDSLIFIDWLVNLDARIEIIGSILEENNLIKKIVKSEESIKIRSEIQEYYIDCFENRIFFDSIEFTNLESNLNYKHILKAIRTIK